MSKKSDPQTIVVPINLPKEEVQNRLRSLVDYCTKEAAALIIGGCQEEVVYDLMLTMRRFSEYPLKPTPTSYVDNEALFGMLSDILLTVKSLKLPEATLEPMSLEEYLREKGLSASPANVSMLFEKLMTLDLQPVSKKGKQKEWMWQRVALDNAWAETMDNAG